MYLLPLISLREGFLSSFQVPHVNFKSIGKTHSTSNSQLSAFLDQPSKKIKKKKNSKNEDEEEEEREKKQHIFL